MNASSSKFLTAVQASCLLTDEQVKQALAALSAESIAIGAQLTHVTDVQLANKMVELGMLNRWQAQQLRAGRSKFNLNDYQIVDSLGQGGMGQVFKAEHSLMGRVVAIKVLPKSKSTPSAIKSFHHEIRTLARLDDPNLVRAYDAGHDGNVYYLVTEFVPGADLRRLVRERGPLTQRDAATIISQAASGLQHAHEQGMIHRDVKPGNLMVTPDGKTKVLDVGLAGFLHEDPGNEDPRKGRIVGTADYLAPEQILSPSKVTAASDIYSLGCTLYFAVTGEVPFPGGTMQEKCYRHLNEAPLHPRRHNQDLSDSFLDVLADMMEKDPNQRIGTAAEVGQRLAAWTDDAVQTPLPEDSSGFARLDASGTTGRAPIDDTRDFPELSPDDLESPSQLSQGTEAVNQASQETTPGIARPAPRAKPPRIPKQEISRPVGLMGERIPTWIYVSATVVGLIVVILVLLITVMLLR